MLYSPGNKLVLIVAIERRTIVILKRFFYVMSLLLVSSGLASAQSPSISGVGMANYTTPLRINNYWSIYGSNLSTGSSGVWFTWGMEERTFPYGYAQNTYVFNSGNDPHGWWYQSSSQINSWITADHQPPYYINGLGGVVVCNYSNSLCSSSYSVAFTG